jgi:hypothetical protein
MITQQQTADYININIDSVLTAEEFALLRSNINSKLATILIKLLGNVSVLTHIRDNESN